MKVIIIGGGWSGCAAAISAKKAGAEVHIYEKTDLLLGDVYKRQHYYNLLRFYMP